MLLVVHHQFRHRLEAFEQQVDVGTLDAQRWLDAQHVAFGEGRQAVHAMPAFQVAADDRHQGTEGAGQGQGVQALAAPAAEFQAKHQAAAVEAVEHLGIVAYQTRQPGMQIGALLRRVLELGAVVGRELVEHGQADGGAEAIYGEGGTVVPVEITAPALLAVDARANGRDTAAQGLGQQHHVRLQAVGGGGEQLAGAAQAGLDFIEDKQGAVLAAEVLRRQQVAWGRGDHARLALHRLDEKAAARRVFSCSSRASRSP